LLWALAVANHARSARATQRTFQGRPLVNLPFRSWLQDQPLPSEVLDLFEEAFRCYRAEAYRAALLFSYLGFLRAVASRLMNAAKPDLLSEKLWLDLQGQLRDEVKWESATFGALERVNPTSILLADEDLRQQVTYWRGRRNDAAHSRENEISAAHVEMIWLFIRSNLAKFVVNGGRSGLLERFRRHFDPAFTPIGQEFSRLVAEIPQAVRRSEFRDFIRELFAILKPADDLEWKIVPAWAVTAPYLRLVDYTVALGNQALLIDLLAEIYASMDLLVATLLARPSLVLQFSNEPSLIRKLWHDLLPTIQMYSCFPIVASLRVLLILLRNQLIPEDQRVEAVEHFVSRIDEGYPQETYDGDLLAALAPFGFFEAVHKNVSQGVERLSHILFLSFEYLLRFPVDVFVARAFADLIPREVEKYDDYCRTAKFCTLEDGPHLRMAFAGEPKILDEILRVARENGVKVDAFEHFMRPPEEPATGGDWFS